jgi:hypothetical protein
MIYAWGRLLTAQRHMHGELSQSTCRDIVVLFTRLRMLCEKYSYQNVPDVSGIDPHVVINEMDIDIVQASMDDTDLYKDMK